MDQRQDGDTHHQGDDGGTDDSFDGLVGREGPVERVATEPTTNKKRSSVVGDRQNNRPKEISQPVMIDERTGSDEQ